MILGFAMGFKQTVQFFRYLPIVGVSALVGAIAVCSVGQVPILLEVKLGADESHIVIDSRTDRFCLVTKVSG